MELLIFFMPMIIMIGFMWLLMVRPQQKKQKEHQELLNNIKVGDDIETIGGIIGKVNSVNDDVIVIFSDKSTLKLNKRAIATVKAKEVSTEV